MGQNLVPLVNIKIAGKWMFIPLKMLLIGIDPSPYPIHESSSVHVFPLEFSVRHPCRRFRDPSVVVDQLAAWPDVGRPSL